MARKFGSITLSEGKRVRLNDFLEVNLRKKKGRYVLDFWLVPLSVRREQKPPGEAIGEQPELTSEIP